MIFARVRLWGDIESDSYSLDSFLTSSIESELKSKEEEKEFEILKRERKRNPQTNRKKENFIAVVKDPIPIAEHRRVGSPADFVDFGRQDPNSVQIQDGLILPPETGLTAAIPSHHAPQEASEKNRAALRMRKRTAASHQKRKKTIPLQDRQSKKEKDPISIAERRRLEEAARIMIMIMVVWDSRLTESKKDDTAGKVESTCLNSNISKQIIIMFAANRLHILQEDSNPPKLA
ncbi:hypothetical protein C8J56DRAFT_893147 [Mycena floridula]|nr:hypothetical protein C8J56DRAFT_893147 [Mycena floridula]